MDARHEKIAIEPRRRRVWIKRCSIALALAAIAPLANRYFVEPAPATQWQPAASEQARYHRPAHVPPTEVGDNKIQLCQYPGSAPAYYDCANGCRRVPACQNMSNNEFQLTGPGEYVVRPRTEHVSNYRLRPDDDLEFVFRITRNETIKPYEINVGDEVRVESFTDKELDRSLIVQPDGTITLRLLGQVRATRHTVTQLRDEIEAAYKKFYKVPAITVTPTKVNTKLEDLRATVDNRAGAGGQGRRARVTPEGTVALPAVGSVPAQGLTLEELKRELDERYSQVVDGIEVTPVLVTRAPRYVFVVGEVKTPGRFTLEGPTTVMQAIALAGSWNVGANVDQVVIFRRAEDWRLLATTLDLRDALLGRKPCPASEIWIADSDLIIVPKSKIMLFDNFVDLVFTKGVYGVFPPTFGASLIQMGQFRSTTVTTGS